MRRIVATFTVAFLVLIAALAPASYAHGRNYRHIWRTQISSADKQWYRNTAACESHNDPTIATGNGYYGAVQWLPATWQAAGGRGLPTQHGRHEQAVLGVRWMHTAGRGQWPNCG